jgi:hypothetical protein
MEKATTSSLDRVLRRLSAVKVVVDLLNHELDLAKADRSVNFERERLEATVTTLEMFIEDIEGVTRAAPAAEEKSKIIEAPRSPASRI